MSKRAIMFLGIEDPAEHLPLSKETFAHIFEWAVTNIKENADGTVSAFLNIKDIHIACNVVKFLCESKNHGTFVFVDFKDGIIDNGVGYYATLKSLLKDSDVHDTVRNPKVEITEATGSFDEIELVMQPIKRCMVKDNIKDFTLESIRALFDIITKGNVCLNKKNDTPKIV